MNSQTNSFILAPCWYWIPGEVIAIAMKSQAGNSVLVLDHSHEMALKILKLALSSRARSFLQGSQFPPGLALSSRARSFLHGSQFPPGLAVSSRARTFLQGSHFPPGLAVSSRARTFLQGSHFPPGLAVCSSPLLRLALEQTAWTWNLVQSSDLKFTWNYNIHNFIFNSAISRIRILG